VSAPPSNTDVLDLITFMASSPSMDEIAQHLVLNTLESFKPRSVLISSFETDGNLRTSGSFGRQVEVPRNHHSQSLWDRTPSADAVRLSRPLHFASAAELQAAYSTLPPVPGISAPMVVWPLVLGQTRLGSLQLHFAELPEEPAFSEEMTNVAAVLGLYMRLITTRAVPPLDEIERTPTPSRNGHRDIGNSNHNDPIHALTARQTRILHLLADGLTNPQIAARIGFSDSTVRQETMAIYRFLGASGRREASRLAALRGLLSEESDILNSASLNFA
jgi:DNA-binding CsgD family transcriptional regulator